jgi:hypothetical protein
MRIIAARGIGHAVAMTEGDGPLAQALEHHHIEFALAGEIDRRIETVGGKTRPRPNPISFAGRVHAAAQSDLVAFEIAALGEEKVLDLGRRFLD